MHPNKKKKQCRQDVPEENDANGKSRGGSHKDCFFFVGGGSKKGWVRKKGRGRKGGECYPLPTQDKKQFSQNRVGRKGKGGNAESA